MKKKALIVVTSNSNLGNSNQKTGWHLSEVSHVYWPLHQGGFEITFASPAGGEAPVEKASYDLTDPENESFVNKFSVQKSLTTIPIREIKATDYRVIYFAGGHGGMWDFPDNEFIEKVTREIYENGGIVAAICHGPAALTNIKLSDGNYLVDGKRINSFTNEEEKEMKRDDVVPFLLETKLKERGAQFIPGEKNEDKVVVDGRLITGQNPQSASSLGKSIVRAYTQIELEDSFGEDKKKSKDDRDSLHWVVQT